MRLFISQLINALGPCEEFVLAPSSGTGLAIWRGAYFKRTVCYVRKVHALLLDSLEERQTSKPKRKNQTDLPHSSSNILQPSPD